MLEVLDVSSYRDKCQRNFAVFSMYVGGSLPRRAQTLMRVRRDHLQGPTTKRANINQFSKCDAQDAEPNHPRQIASCAATAWNRRSTSVRTASVAPDVRNCSLLYPQSLRSIGLRRLVMPVDELMQSEWDLVGMRCTASDNALQLDRIVGDRTYAHQLGFNGFRRSH